jgi:hypothetical protein
MGQFNDATMVDRCPPRIDTRSTKGTEEGSRQAAQSEPGASLSAVSQQRQTNSLNGRKEDSELPQNRRAQETERAGRGRRNYLR